MGLASVGSFLQMWPSDTAPGPDAAEVILGLSTAAAGAALLLAPARVGHMLGQAALPPEGIVRLLGVRYLSQGGAELLHPQRTTFAAAAGVDALHAASLLPVAALLPRYRKAALLSILFALACAAANSGVAARKSS